jgi:hypothetical protein
MFFFLSAGHVCVVSSVIRSLYFSLFLRLFVCRAFKLSMVILFREGKRIKPLNYGSNNEFISFKNSKTSR